MAFQLPQCTCATDMYVHGMLDGEEMNTLLRLAALILSSSIISAWYDGKYRSHMRLFCLHWASGLVYTLSTHLMSTMILLCWTSEEFVTAIYILKFLELTATNVWSLSSLAVAILIAFIVEAFDGCRRVPAVIGSPRTLWTVVFVSIFLTICSAISWTEISISGSYFWVYNKSERHSDWIGVSFALTQSLAGVVMLGVLVYLMTPRRRASLLVCCKTSDRIFHYFLLTVFGVFVYAFTSVAVYLLQFDHNRSSGSRTGLLKWAWSFKYLHVIADTLILMSALTSQYRRRQESSGSIASASGEHHAQDAALRCAGSSTAGTQTASPAHDVTELAEDGAATAAGAELPRTSGVTSSKEKDAVAVGSAVKHHVTSAPRVGYFVKGTA